ncbi:MAG: ScpA family protein [Patescibacteria group bacterium]
MVVDIFAVKVGEFEGPLEVLLELVEARELGINQVSLAAVADSFLEYLRKLPGSRRSDGQAGMAILGNFVVVASTLILIKSVSLLPTLAVTDEEQGEISDLERRLKLYQVVKDTLPLLKAALAETPIFYRDPRARVLNPVFSPTAEITLPGVQVTMQRLLRDLPQLEVLPEKTVKRLVSIEQVIGDLTRRIQSALTMSFSDFVKDKREKVNVIVSFLALLELFKQGLVTVIQSEHFAEIRIETKDSKTPRYG